METLPLPKPRPRRVNWRARAKANESAAQLLARLIDDSYIDLVAQTDEGALLAVTVPHTYLDKLAAFGASDLDLEPEEDCCPTETGELDDADYEEDDPAEDGGDTEPNGDEGDYSDGCTGWLGGHIGAKLRPVGDRP